MKNKFPEFALSSWAIDNRTAIFLLTIVIIIMGSWSWVSLPKENFPEIKFPVIYVSTPYPGTAPKDIEKLVCKPIEDEVQNIVGVKKINSTAIQDFGNVFIEFESDVDITEAKRDVQEAVNRARGDLPGDLPNDPMVMDIDFSEFPIMFLNLSGPFDDVELKEFAEDIQDEVEDFDEIRRADIVGALEREVQVEVDLYKMQSAWVTFGDIEQTIANENVIISGGELDINNQKMGVRINGEFKSTKEIGDLVVRSGKGHSVYLNEIATVKDGFKDQNSFARLDGEPVISLSVVKKGGENLIDAAAKIREKIEEMKAEEFPEKLTVTISADQSVRTLNNLNELTNTVIIGFILVTLILMFFMGVRDSLFVGMAIPLSTMISFMVIPFMDFSVNMIVLFGFILALGIVVDNAIVVIENTYRIFTDEGLPIEQAAKKAAGEVIMPVFSGTLTTIMPFTPLLFWPGSIGEFMGFLPITMIIVLFASLFVAYVINPVFAVTFMKKKEKGAKPEYKKYLIYSAVMVVIAILFHVAGNALLGNLMFFMVAFVWLNVLVLRHVLNFFQERIIPAVKGGYRQLLTWALKPGRPGWIVSASFLFVILSLVFVGMNPFKVVLFPDADPNQVIVYSELPVGTNVVITDSVTRVIEKKVYDILGEDNPNVQSVVTNIAVGAGDANSFDQGSPKSNKGKVTIEFVEFKYRTEGYSTSDVLEEVRRKVKGISGTKITVGKEAGGPPAGADVDLLLTSEDFNSLIYTSKDLMQFLDSLSIPGVEEYKWDAEEKKSELVVNVDRVRASELGVSTGQVGSAIRTAIFGREASKYRPLGSEDEYDITVRLSDKYRNDISSLLNMNITFMDQATGGFKSIPISAFAEFDYQSDYSSINRTDLKKSVNITSNVMIGDGYNVAEVNQEVAYWVEKFKQQGRMDPSIGLKQGGQAEDQAKEMAFLGRAFVIAVLLIFLILVVQFNPMINVLIILSQVILSVAGAFFGVSLLGDDFSIIMGGVAMVSLTGIVVNNGIIMLDFINILEKRGLSRREAVIEGATIRFTPVLLTAFSTVLGLVPLAISLNINFSTLLTSFDPQIFLGGDNAAFWGPFAVTVISGLTFATLVTLIFVPVLYYATHKFNDKVLRFLGFKQKSPAQEQMDLAVINQIGNENGSDNGKGVGKTPKTKDLEHPEGMPEL